VSVAVIIPALNEAGNIAALVREARRQPVRWVIVVDNGSTDETATEARAAGAEVVAEPRRGYGYACAAGSARALAAGASVLVYMDGDGSARPEELPRLLEPLERGAADLVLGSRVRGGAAAGALAPHQRFGNALSAALMRRLYGIAVTDLGPYRAIRAGLLRELAMREMTYGWPTEMTVKTARRGARVIEVPVSWANRRGGRSKVSGTVRGSVLAGIYILGVTLRYARR
jgi:glycosyltransferase involved in cell wall biosynthesis